jgi:hypothetical protein
MNATAQASVGDLILEVVAVLAEALGVPVSDLCPDCHLALPRRTRTCPHCRDRAAVAAVLPREYARNGHLMPARRADGAFVPDLDPEPCLHCGGSRAGKNRGDHGYCRRCDGRWADNGYPPGGPPPVRHSTGAAGRAGRIEDYVILTRERGLSSADAALALGVTRRTLVRYEAALREREAAKPPPVHVLRSSAEGSAARRAA